jgi:hypothetical protein
MTAPGSYPRFRCAVQTLNCPVTFLVDASAKKVANLPGMCHHIRIIYPD